MDELTDPAGIAALAAGALALVALLAAAPQAVADHPAAKAYGESLPASVKRITGPDTVATKDGLLKVQPEAGPAVITHGPDPRAELALSASALPGEVGFRPGDEELLRVPGSAQHGKDYVRRRTGPVSARVVAFLASKDADFVTGEIIEANGGAFTT